MLELNHISKSYNNAPVLSDVSFRVKTGETVCLLGASGSGKSTLLRIIAGLEPPDAGTVCWNHGDLAPLPPHLRDFGLVFQDYALFPHLTVFENVVFGLQMREKIWSAGARSRKVRQQAVSLQRQRVDEVLALVNLRGFDSRRVTDLSGGEQQRVALARALAPHPRLLMFDEPLGALDRSLKADLLAELRNILRKTKVPAIYVTHDQEEAFAIADRVLLLHDGKIVRAGKPADVWNDPRSAWAARFLGVGNLISGKMKDESGKMKVETDFGDMTIKCKHGHKRGDGITLLLKSTLPSPGGRGAGRRAEPVEAGGVVTRIKARVEESLFNRDQFQVRLRGGLVVQMKTSPKVGSLVSVDFTVECLGHA